MHRIAIIEDEADISSLLAHCFTCEVYQATTTRDGQAGLDIVRRLRPDLVILDLLLPRLNGWDVFDALRANEATRGIPVVVLSADS